MINQPSKCFQLEEHLEVYFLLELLEVSLQIIYSMKRKRTFHNFWCNKKPEATPKCFQLLEHLEICFQQGLLGVSLKIIYCLKTPVIT